MKHNKKRIFLFDFDGVIIDSLPIITDVYNKTCSKFGLDRNYSEEEFAKFYIGNFHESLAKVIPKDLLDKVLEEKGKEFTRRVAEYRVFPMIKEVLSKLGEKFEIVIVSSNTTSFIKECLKHNALPDYVVLGGDIEKSKVKKILKIKEENPDKEIFYVGDTVGDIKEAKEAGIISVAAAWGFHKKSLLAKHQPDFILMSPDELLNI